MKRKSQIPEFAIAALSHYSPAEKSAALQWAFENLTVAALAQYYRYALYYRKSMRREEQRLVDQIGNYVSRENKQMNGSLNGLDATGMSSYGRFRAIPQRFPSQPWQRAQGMGDFGGNALSDAIGMGDFDPSSIGELISGAGSGIKDAASGIGGVFIGQQKVAADAEKARQQFEINKMLAAKGLQQSVAANTSTPPTTPILAKATPKKSNTALYIALGVGGVAIVGGVSYLVFRKK